MPHIVIVDNPMSSAALALLLQQHTTFDVMSLAPHVWHKAPPGAMLLVEERLPERLSGFRLTRDVLRERSDLVPILWTACPTPLLLWAASVQHLPCFLDKSVPLDDLLIWIDRAAAQHTAWPSNLLEEARKWRQNVAMQLRALNRCHWELWRAMLCDASSADIAEERKWSKRTAERRSRIV